MASNIPITTGQGQASVATEQIGTVQYQKIKVVGGETGSTSVWGITPDGSGKVSVIGTVTTTFSGSPSISGAVTIVGSPSISGAINVSSSVMLGSSNASVITVPQSSSIIAIVTGSVTQGTTPWIVTGSVQTIGSVAAFQGTNPWQINHVGNGSIITIQTGSVITTQIGSVITVSQGSVSAFTTITSIATANGGLPIYAPLGSRIQGTADLRVVQGGSVAAIAAQGAGVRTYIDHVQVANFGSASVLVTIADNTTSILGCTIAPAGGGSNFNPFYRPAANSPITASLNGTASVLVSMQGFTSST